MGRTPALPSGVSSRSSRPPGTGSVSSESGCSLGRQHGHNVGAGQKRGISDPTESSRIGADIFARPPGDWHARGQFQSGGRRSSHGAKPARALLPCSPLVGSSIIPVSHAPRPRLRNLYKVTRRLDHARSEIGAELGRMAELSSEEEQETGPTREAPARASVSYGRCRLRPPPGYPSDLLLDLST